MKSKKMIYVESRKSLETKMKAVEDEYEHIGELLACISDRLSHMSYLAKGITSDIGVESRKELETQIRAFFDISIGDIRELRGALERCDSVNDTVSDCLEKILLTREQKT